MPVLTLFAINKSLKYFAVPLQAVTCTFTCKNTIKKYNSARKRQQ